MECDLKYKSLTIYSETISAGSLCPSALRDSAITTIFFFRYIFEDAIFPLEIL